MNPYLEPDASCPHTFPLYFPVFPFSLGLPSGLFRSGSETKILYKFLITPIRATFPDHFFLLDLITNNIS